MFALTAGPSKVWAGGSFIHREILADYLFYFLMPASEEDNDTFNLI